MEVDETLKRIQAQKGVTGVIIMDNLGKLAVKFYRTYSRHHCEIPLSF